jgi:cephalosporin-C deacetylase-like acetyl esterase
VGIPLEQAGKLPAVVALHGTYAQGARRAAGLDEYPDKADLDHLCRRGDVGIAPEHFVSGHRIPPKGPYDTTAFHEKHPDWTSVGKFTYEHSIAIDVLETMTEVDAENIGVLGHSLGGHGSIFLAAYDERIKAAASNCAAPSFRHNPRVEAWSRNHWYVYFKHLRDGLLKNELPPIDFHHMVGLTAPRPMLQIVGLNDGMKPTQRQRVLMTLAIADLYDVIGAPENYAFFIHGRGHSVPHESRALMYAWMDTYRKPPEATATKLVEAPEAE